MAAPFRGFRAEEDHCDVLNAWSYSGEWDPGTFCLWEMVIKAEWWRHWARDLEVDGLNPTWLSRIRPCHTSLLVCEWWVLLLWPSPLGELQNWYPVHYRRVRSEGGGGGCGRRGMCLTKPCRDSANVKPYFVVVARLFSTRKTTTKKRGKGVTVSN